MYQDIPVFNSALNVTSIKIQAEDEKKLAQAIREVFQIISFDIPYPVGSVEERKLEAVEVATDANRLAEHVSKSSQALWEKVISDNEYWDVLKYFAKKYGHYLL